MTLVAQKASALLRCLLVTKLLLLLKSSMAQIWVAVHSLLTKLVRWSHVLAAAADAVDSAAVAVVTVADSAAAVVAIAVVTAVETVGNSLEIPKQEALARGLFFCSNF